MSHSKNIWSIWPSPCKLPTITLVHYYGKCVVMVIFLFQIDVSTCHTYYINKYKYWNQIIRLFSHLKLYLPAVMWNRIFLLQISKIPKLSHFLWSRQLHADLHGKQMCIKWCLPVFAILDSKQWEMGSASHGTVRMMPVKHSCYS